MADIKSSQPSKHADFVCMFYSLWTSGYTIRRIRATNTAAEPHRQRECSGPEAAKAEHVATDHKRRIKSGIPRGSARSSFSMARSVISKHGGQGWPSDRAQERLIVVFQDNYHHRQNATGHVCVPYLTHSFCCERTEPVMLVKTKQRFNCDTEKITLYGELAKEIKLPIA